MTPEQIAAERERFIDAWMRSGKSYDLRFDHENRKFISWEVENHWWFSWMKRTEIAHAEKAELVAERDRLRDRVRELAELHLVHELRGIKKGSATDSAWWWRAASGNAGRFGLLALAESAGCWFDDDFKKVPLAEWRARMGGVG